MGPGWLQLWVRRHAATLSHAPRAAEGVPHIHHPASVFSCRGVSDSVDCIMHSGELPPRDASTAAAPVNPACGALSPQPQPVSPPAQQQPALPLPEQQLPPQQQEGTALPAAAKPPPACRVPGCTEPLVNIYNQVRLPPGCWSSARAQDGAPVFLSPAREPRQRLRRVPNLWEA